MDIMLTGKTDLAADGIAYRCIPLRNCSGGRHADQLSLGRAAVGSRRPPRPTLAWPARRRLARALGAA